MQPLIKALCYIFQLFLCILLILIHKAFIRDTVHHTIHPRGIERTIQTLQTWNKILIMGGIVITITNITLVFFSFFRPLVGVWNNKTYLWTKQPRAKAYYILLNLFVLVLWLTPILTLVAPPFYVTAVEWEREYKDACKGMAIIAALDSSVKERSINDIRFTNQTTNVGYSMSMSPIPMPRTMDPNGVYNFSVMTTGAGASSNPLSWTNIEYDLGRKQYRVLNSSNEVVQEGEFGVGEHFGIPKMGLQGNLSSFDASCHWDPTVVIVDSEKKVIVKTAQFKMCGQLQACVDESLGDLAAVPVGLLVLQRAVRGPLTCCGGRRSPGKGR